MVTFLSGGTGTPKLLAGVPDTSDAAVIGKAAGLGTGPRYLPEERQTEGREIARFRRFSGVREALSQTPVVAVSPFVGETLFSGPADKLREAVGYEASTVGVAEEWFAGEVQA